MEKRTLSNRSLFFFEVSFVFVFENEQFTGQGRILDGSRDQLGAYFIILRGKGDSLTPRPERGNEGGKKIRKNEKQRDKPTKAFSFQ